MFHKFQQNKFVKQLDISDNDIRTDGACAVAQMLAQNECITDLVRTLMLTNTKFI